MHCIVLVCVVSGDRAHVYVCLGALDSCVCACAPYEMCQFNDVGRIRPGVLLSLV